MITYLHGTVVDALPTQVTVDVHGIGYEALIPLSSYDKLPKPGLEVKLLTHLVVREDAHVLYGFMSAEERELFRLLIHTVSGIGPKTALNVLSGMNPVAFRGAVSTGDVKALSKISGVGKKTAERIVVELRDKFGAAGAWQASSAKHGLSPEDQKLNDAVLALMALDYTQMEAHDAVRAAAAALGPQASLEAFGSSKPAEAAVKDPSAAVRPLQTQPGSGKPKGVVVPHRARWLHRRAAGLLFVLERILTATLRFQWKDRSGLLEPGPAQPIIFCLWHNRLALSMACHRFTRRHQPDRRLAALISASKDGAFLATILERFGVQAVRGSTSRRGPQALLELTTWAGRGYGLAITPDGPRGPRYVVQPGVIALAQLTGVPIVPVTYRMTWLVRSKSWDRFQIPLPFAKCEVIFEAPMHVPREASDAEREALRVELQNRLREMSRE